MASRSGTKRTRKEKGKGQSSSAPHEPMTDLFFDSDALAKYQSLRTTKIIFGRVLNSKSNYEANSLHVQSKIDYQGLTSFLATELPVYPSLMKQFYANLRHPSNDQTGHLDRQSLLTKIGFVEVTITEQFLRELFNFPEDNDDSYDVSDPDEAFRLDTHFNVSRALFDICEAPRESYQKLLAIHLKLPCRLIHRIVALNLNPRSGSYDQVTQADIYLTWAIWSRRQINWPGFLFGHLTRGIKRKDANLAFGIALSKLFMQANAVSNTEFIPLNHNHYFNETMLQRFGFELGNGEWIPKRGAPIQQDPLDQDEDQGEQPRGGDHIPMDTQGPSIYPQAPTNLDIMHAIQGLSMRTENIYDHVTHLSQDVRFLRQHVRRLDHRLNSFEDVYRTHYPGYEFPPPPPEDSDQ